MNNQIDVSIIIVTWNSEQWLGRCLKSIFDKTSEISFEIIVIDNASRDQSVKIAMENEGVKVIKNPENRGWAAAVNQGIEASSGKYIFLLNPDTELYDRTVEQLAAFLNEYELVGIVAPHLMNEDESTQISIRRRPRLRDQLMIILKLHVLFPDAKAIRHYLYRDFNYRQTQEVEQVMGAAMMIRREVINKVGIFDETFFLWFDEVDFCLRVYERTEYKIFYDSEAHIIHAGGASFAQVGTFKKQRIYVKSLRYFFRKHKYWWSYFVVFIFTPLAWFIGLMSSFFKRSKKGKKLEKKTQDEFKQVKK